MTDKEELYYHTEVTETSSSLQGGTPSKKLNTALLAIVSVFILLFVVLFLLLLQNFGFFTILPRSPFFSFYFGKNADIDRATDTFYSYFLDNLSLNTLPAKSYIKNNTIVKDKTTVVFTPRKGDTSYLGAVLHYFPNTVHLKSIFLIKSLQNETITEPLNASQSETLLKKYFLPQTNPSSWTCTVEKNISLCSAMVKSPTGTNGFTFEYISGGDNFTILYRCFRVGQTSTTSCTNEFFY